MRRKLGSSLWLTRSTPSQPCIYGTFHHFHGQTITRDSSVNAMTGNESNTIVLRDKLLSRVNKEPGRLIIYLFNTVST